MKTMKPFNDHRFQRKAGFSNRHHLVPRSRGGKTEKKNILSIDVYKHAAWHLLFGNKTLSEVIELLTRLKRIKDRQGD